MPAQPMTPSKCFLRVLILWFCHCYNFVPRYMSPRVPAPLERSGSSLWEVGVGQ